MLKVRIEDWLYDDLNEEKMFINIYDMDFKSLCEMNRYWKEFCFDLLDKLQLKNLIMVKQENLLTFLKNNYKIIIEENKLDIDFRDYIELNDYVTLKEWLKYTNHFIERNENGLYIWIQD